MIIFFFIAAHGFAQNLVFSQRAGCGHLCGHLAGTQRDVRAGYRPQNTPSVPLPENFPLGLTRLSSLGILFHNSSCILIDIYTPNRKPAPVFLFLVPARSLLQISFAGAVVKQRESSPGRAARAAELSPTACAATCTTSPLPREASCPWPTAARTP